MTVVISVGVLLVFGLVLVCLWQWGRLRCIGTTPVSLFTFMAILFTSGLDVGLIMFPLTEFPLYADTVTHPEYAFTNPLAIEFGFWGFLIWSFYFLTSFYFCVIEPHVGFFEIPVVKLINNVVIVGTCAFTASLFLSYLPGYLPALGGGERILGWHGLIVLLVILTSAISATDIRLVRWLSVGSVWTFLALILGVSLHANVGLAALG
ncbi:MAG: BCCT family transporter, partial [Gammaproteobacteria bacterium]